MPPPTTTIDAMARSETARARGSGGPLERCTQAKIRRNSPNAPCPPPRSTTSSCAAAAPSPSWRPPRTPRIWSPAPPTSATARWPSPIATALSGAPRFLQAAQAAGLHPIVGADVSLEPPAAQAAPGFLLLLVESAARLPESVSTAHARARALREGRVPRALGRARGARRGARRARPRRRRARRRRCSSARRPASAAGASSSTSRAISSAAPRRPRAAPWRSPKRRASRSSRPATCASPRPPTARCFDALTCLRAQDLARPRRPPARLQRRAPPAPGPRDGRALRGPAGLAARHARDRRALRLQPGGSRLPLPRVPGAAAARPRRAGCAGSPSSARASATAPPCRRARARSSSTSCG